jgi:hypothetical protein
MVDISGSFRLRALVAHIPFSKSTIWAWVQPIDPTAECTSAYGIDWSGEP